MIHNGHDPAAAVPQKARARRMDAAEQLRHAPDPLIDTRGELRQPLPLPGLHDGGGAEREEPRSLARSAMLGDPPWRALLVPGQAGGECQNHLFQLAPRILPDENAPGHSVAPRRTRAASQCAGAREHRRSTKFSLRPRGGR